MSPHKPFAANRDLYSLKHSRSNSASSGNGSARFNQADKHLRQDHQCPSTGTIYPLKCGLLQKSQMPGQMQFSIADNSAKFVWIIKNRLIFLTLCAIFQHPMRSNSATQTDKHCSGSGSNGTPRPKPNPNKPHAKPNERTDIQNQNFNFLYIFLTPGFL